MSKSDSLSPAISEKDGVIIDNVGLEEDPTGKGRRRCCACVECCKDVDDFKEEVSALCARCTCRGCVQQCCSPKAIKGKLPILNWLPKYRLPEFQGDLIAGLTVGLTVIPQGLAYAQVAELPPQYGLYSAFMGCFIYCLLGTSKDITLGPTAIMSLMTAEFGKSWFEGDATIAIILSLFGGIIQLAMGILHIGFLVEYISYPVINSFTTAAAITIGFGQIRKWFGLRNVSREFLHQVYDTFHKLPETNPWDFLLGFVVILMLYGMKRMKNIKYKDRVPVSTGKMVWRKFIWLLGTARNAILVVLASVFAGLMLQYDIDVLSLTGKIDAGLPAFAAPKFYTTGPLGGNGTDANATVTYGSSEIFSKIGAGFAIIPIIGLVETIAIGKAFARKNNYLIDANQELIAIGASNIVGCFVGAYPVTGSFSRTAVNSQSGVKTPLGGIWTAGLVLLALGVLTPLFRFVPDAALAAVIIMAVLDMASFAMLRQLWRVKRVDMVPWLTTFIFSFVLGIEYGILIGVGVSLLMLLFPWARPSIKPKSDYGGTTELLSPSFDKMEHKVVVMELDSGLLFPGMEHVKDKALKYAVRDADGPRSAVIDMSHVSNLDYSTISGLNQIDQDFKLHGVRAVFTNLQPHVLGLFKKAVLLRDVIRRETNEDGMRYITEWMRSDETNVKESLLAADEKTPGANGDVIDIPM